MPHPSPLLFYVCPETGNVKDIIDQSKAAQDEYLNRFDQIRQYMVAMNVPSDTMDRTKQWCLVRALRS